MSSPPMRSAYEAIVDRLLLLFLLIENRKKGFAIEGNSFERQLKLQKMLYFAELRMFLDRYKGLNYYFFKWTYGPFAQELYIDSEHLIKTKIFEIYKKWEIRATKQGSQLIETLSEVFSQNADVVQYFTRVINEFGGYNAGDIRDVAYAYPVVGKKISIRRIKKGELILPKLSLLAAEKIFRLDEEWLDTLEVLFDPYLYSAITQSMELMKNDRGRPFIAKVREPLHA